MSLNAQHRERDAILVDLLRQNMAQTRSSALAGAASFGRLSVADEAEVISHVLEKLLCVARSGEAIENIASLAFQIGRRRAIDLDRKRRIVARWIASARVTESRETLGAECLVERMSHARKMLEAAGPETVWLALSEAPGAGAAERKRISRARERVRRASAELY